MTMSDFHVFVAHYDDAKPCPTCAGDILAGERVGYDEWDCLEHEACHSGTTVPEPKEFYLEVADPEVNQDICMRCFTLRSLSGECACVG